MQERPDQSTVLMAMAQFLATEVRPAVADKALSFRVLIASAVATSMAIEQHGMEDREVAEVEGLLKVLGQPEADAAGESQRRALLRTLNAEVAAALRSDKLDEEAVSALQSHLKKTLAARLRAINPRFDLRDSLEKP